MSKIVIDFNIDSSEDRDHVKYILDARGMRCSIENYCHEVLRGFVKHRNLSDAQLKIVEEMVQKSMEYFEEYLV